MVAFHYRVVAGLPKLAWLAEWRLSESAIHVLLGEAVEASEHFFVEGCWNGPFSDGAFDHAEAVFATGAVVRGDGVVFVPPAHTIDSLFYTVRDGCLTVANSLAVLLARLGDRLLPERPGYDEAFDSIALGIDDYQRAIPTRLGDVQRLLFRNLRVGADGVVDLVDKPLPPRLPDYERYVGYLEATYDAIVANIRDPDRARKMAIFSTQSSGYDTTAVNAVAVKRGLDKVFTSVRGRDKAAFTTFERQEPDDDGSPIGRALGFACIPIDRLAYKRNTRWDEALYYAGAHSIHDANLMDINDHVRGVAVLLTGTMGEVWRGREYYDPDHVDAIGPQLWRADLAGHGMGEVRLSVGLVFLPFPYIGAQRRADILDIADRPEMAQWRLGLGYDKPLARRIAEERGVPRQLFGMRKVNSTVSLPRPPVPVTADLRRRYFDFLVGARLVSRWQIRCMPAVHLANQALYYFSPRRYRLVYYGTRVVAALTGRPWSPRLLLARLNGTLHAFCVNEVADRHARVLDARSDARERPRAGGPPLPGASASL